MRQLLIDESALEGKVFETSAQKTKTLEELDNYTDEEWGSWAAEWYRGPEQGQGSGQGKGKGWAKAKACGNDV